MDLGASGPASGAAPASAGLPTPASGGLPAPATQAPAAAQEDPMKALLDAVKEDAQKKK
jgi:hypothetical protein